MRYKVLHTIFASLSIFLVFCLGLELLARAEFVQATLLPPSYGTQDALVDLKFSYMEQQESWDCIFIGSSMTMTGIDPSVVASAYHTYTPERPLNCFNFNINGLSAKAMGILVPLMVERYQPRFIVVEISHHNFLNRQVEPFEYSVFKNPWLNFLNGDFSTQGWLLEHSQAYRYVYTYQGWASPNFAEELASELENGTYFTVNGFFPAHVPAHNVRGPIADTNGLDRQITRSHRRFKFTEANLRGLEQVLQVQGKTQLILLEMPVHESYIGYYPDGVAERTAFMETIATYAEKYHVPLWYTNDKLSIPDEFWHSRNHLLAYGALLFSDWLGRELALAETQGFPVGDVPDPTLPLHPIENFLTTPLGLPPNHIADYQRFVPDLPEDAIIVNLSDENPHYFAYNIARYIDIKGREKDDFALLWLLEHVQPATTQLEANLEADYVIFSDYWLRQQSSIVQQQFQNPALYGYEEIVFFRHPGLPIRYRVFKVP